MDLSAGGGSTCEDSEAARVEALLNIEEARCNDIISSEQARQQSDAAAMLGVAALHSGLVCHCRCARSYRGFSGAGPRCRCGQLAHQRLRMTLTATHCAHQGSYSCGQL